MVKIALFKASYSKDISWKRSCTKDPPESVHSPDVLVLRNNRSNLKVLKLLLMAPRAHNLTFKGLERPSLMFLAF